MNKKNSLKDLENAISNEQPLKLWLDDTYMGIYIYENNRYQGTIGYFDIEDLLEGLNDGWVTAEIGIEE